LQVLHGFEKIEVIVPENLGIPIVVMYQSICGEMETL
jgi:hypothetical protein